MPSGPVTNTSLMPVATSAGTIHRPVQDFGSMTWRDLLALADTAARRLDGAYSIATAEGPDGITITVTTNAGTVTVGPYPFANDAVRQLLEYVNRERKPLIDGL